MIGVELPAWQANRYITVNSWPTPIRLTEEPVIPAIKVKTFETISASLNLWSMDMGSENFSEESADVLTNRIERIRIYDPENLRI